MNEVSENVAEIDSPAIGDELATLARLLATRTRERDDEVAQRADDRKAYDAERQELRREVSALRHDNEELTERLKQADRHVHDVTVAREQCRQLQQDLAAANERTAQAEAALAEARKQHMEALAEAAEKIASAETSARATTKEVEALRAEKLQTPRRSEPEAGKRSESPRPQEAKTQSLMAAFQKEQAKAPAAAALQPVDAETKQAIDLLFAGKRARPTQSEIVLPSPARATQSEIVLPEQRPTAAAAPPTAAPPSEFFQRQTGTWTAYQGGYYAAAAARDADAISVLQRAAPLPADLLVELTAQATLQPGFHSNAFVIFDYRGPSDFKYAGFRVLAKQWVIGQRLPPAWNDLATCPDALAAGTAYALRLSLRNTSAELTVNGTSKISFAFQSPLSEGRLGLATQGSISQFGRLTISDASQASVEA